MRDFGGEKFAKSFVESKCVSISTKRKKHVLNATKKKPQNVRVVFLVQVTRISPSWTSWPKTTNPVSLTKNSALNSPRSFSIRGNGPKRSEIPEPSEY